MKTEQEIREKLISLKKRFKETQDLMLRHEKFSVPHFWNSQIGLKQQIILLEWVLEHQHA